MFYLFNYSGHIQLYLEFKFAKKPAKHVFKKIVVGNGQITHKFLDFPKFSVKLPFFAFIASKIKDSAC